MNDPELQAIVGPRATYYLKQWHGISKRKANWAAFFWSCLWLSYRRMYGLAAVVYAILLVEVALEDPVLSLLGYAEMPRALDRAITFVPGVICGAMGNHWYRAHVEKVVAVTRTLGLPEEEHLKELSRKGGTRAWHAVGLFLVFFVLAMLTGFLQALIKADV